MAFDAFIKIDGIPGEATDDKHKDWIELSSFSWGVSQPVAMAGGGLSAGKANFQDFSIMKKLDKSSPILFQACATGKHVKSLTVSFCRATGDKKEYLAYKFADVMLTNYQASGAPAGGEGLPMESLGFTYTKVELNYTPIDAKGTAGSPVSTAYDLKAAKSA
jgi:type VI secretion system secreted protein Hcp